MRLVRDFIRDVDRRWDGEALRLHVIGSTALMLQATYERGTKDSDILETADLSAQAKAALLSLAGAGTTLQARHRIYFDVVRDSLPFLPQQPLWHDVPDLNAHLAHFEVHALDIVDVVVSKLKRFNANDREDIDAMIDAGRVPHSRLVDRFNAAIDFWSCDARADDFPIYVDNLHTVERDAFGVEATPISLPHWVSD